MPHSPKQLTSVGPAAAGSPPPGGPQCQGDFVTPAFGTPALGSKGQAPGLRAQRPARPLTTHHSPLTPLPMALLLAGALLLTAGCRNGPFARQTVLPPGMAAATAQAEAAGQTYTEPVDKRPLPDLATTAPLPAVLDYAFTSNAELEAAYRDWRAALARIPQAGALDDPRLEFGFLFSPDVFSSFRSIVDNITVMLSRDFPAKGKREAKVEQALHAAEANSQRFIATRYRVQTRAAKAYAALALNAAYQAQNAAALRLLKQADEVVTHRFHGMDPGAADSLINLQKTATEIKNVETDQRALDIQRRGLVAELNAALSRPPDATLGTITLPTLTPPAEPAAALFARLVETNPELAALRSEIAAGHAAETLARLAARADYSLGAGLDAALVPTIKAGINLPTNRAKIRAGIAEAIANREANEARLRGKALDLQARAVMALTAMDDADRVIHDYGTDIAPATRKLLDAQLAAYSAGTGDLLDILDSERLLVDYQRLIARAHADRLNALSDLDELLGGGLLKW